MWALGGGSLLTTRSGHSLAPHSSYVTFGYYSLLASVIGRTSWSNNSKRIGENKPCMRFEVGSPSLR